MATITASNNGRRASRQLSHSGSGNSIHSSQSGMEVRPSFPIRPAFSSTRTGSSPSIQSRGSFSNSSRHSVAASVHFRYNPSPGLADRRQSLGPRQASSTSAVAPRFDTSSITLDADTTSAVRLRNITRKEAKHYAGFTTGMRTFGYKPDYLATAQGLSGVPSNFMVDFFIQTEAGLLAWSIRLSECGSTHNIDRKDAKRLISYLSRNMSALDDSQTSLPLPGVYLLYIEFPFGLGKEHAVHAKFNFNWSWADPQATIREGYLADLHVNTIHGKQFGDIGYKALLRASHRDGSPFNQYVSWNDLAQTSDLQDVPMGLDNRPNILAYLGQKMSADDFGVYRDWRVQNITFNLAKHLLNYKLVYVGDPRNLPRSTPPTNAPARTLPTASQQSQGERRRSSILSIGKKGPLVTRGELSRENTAQQVTGASQAKHKHRSLGEYFRSRKASSKEGRPS